MKLQNRSWYALLATVAFVPLATTATSLFMDSLPWTYDSYVIPKLAALGVLTALALVLWAAAADPADGIRWHRAGHAGTAFIVLATLSTIFALDPAVAFFGKDAANGLVAYLCYAAVFFLLLQQLRGVGRVLALTRTIVASASVAAAATLIQAARMTTPYVESLGLGDVGFLYGRGGALFGNPDFVGAFLVLPFLLALALVFAETRPASRILAGAGAALIGAASLVTFARAGWIGIAAGGVLLLVLLARRGTVSMKLIGTGAAILLVAILAGLSIVGVSLTLSRLTDRIGEGVDEYSSSRISGWADAAAIVAERPLLGAGPDSYTYAWYYDATALADPVTGAQSYFEDPHNVYLALAATMGVPALLAFLGLTGMALAAGFGTLRRVASSAANHTLYAGWVAGAIGLLFTAIFAVTTIPTMLLIAVTLAVLLAPSASSVEDRPQAFRASRAVAAVLALVCLVSGLVPFVADYHLGQYLRNQSAASLERARNTAPWSPTIQTYYLGYQRARLTPLLEQGGTEAALAVDDFDAMVFRLIDAHPHELLYTLQRVDVLGQAAGMLGAGVGEKALGVIRLARLDYPQLGDLQVAEAKALNNLDRYDEAVALLEAMGPSIRRDTALAESYLLAGDEASAIELIASIEADYGGTALAEAWLAQPTIAQYR